MATAVATSAFTAVAPATSDAATSLTSQMKVAKATIKKPYDTYMKATTTPASLNLVKSQLIAAKKAQANIQAAIKKSHVTTAQKKAKYAEMKAYDKYITYAQIYVNAVSINVKTPRNTLTEAVKTGDAGNVLSAQTALNVKIAELEKAIAKVYGKSTRSLLTKYYVTPAKNHAASVNTEMNVYKAYQQMERENLIANNLTKAGEVINSVKAEVETLRTQDSELAKNLLKIVEETNQLYVKAMTPVVDFTALDQVIADFAAVQAEKYTVESYAVYKTAVDSAKTVKANADATPAQVDVAVKAVNDAKTALVEVILVKTVKELNAAILNIVPGVFAIKIPLEDAKQIGATEASTLIIKVEGKADLTLTYNASAKIFINPNIQGGYTQADLENGKVSVK